MCTGSQGCGLALLPYRSMLAGSMVQSASLAIDRAQGHGRCGILWHWTPGRQKQSVENADSGLTTSFGLSLGLASLGLLGFDLPPALDFRVGPPISHLTDLAASPHTRQAGWEVARLKGPLVGAHLRSTAFLGMALPAGSTLCQLKLSAESFSGTCMRLLQGPQDLPRPLYTCLLAFKLHGGA